MIGFSKSAQEAFVMNIRIGTRICFAVLALWFPLSAQAQSDFVKAHGTFLAGATRPAPTLKLNASYQPKVGIEDSDLEADLVRVDGRLMYAHGVDDDVAILGAINFGLRHYDFDARVPGGGSLDRNLYEIAIELGVHWFVSDRILVSAVFRPGIFSDLDDSLTGDDILYHGTVVGTYRLNDSWFLKLGVAVGEDFDETQVTPVGGFSWVSSDQLRVDVLLPKSASVTWQPWSDRSFELVPGLYLQGKQYNIDTATGDGELQIQDIRFDITGSCEVTKGSRLSLSLGSNFRGSYEIEGAGGANIDVDQDPSVYVAVGFATNF